VSSVELLSLLGQFLLVTVIAFVVIGGVASFMRFQGITTLAEDHDGDVHGGEEAFHALIARAISRSTATGRSFSMGVVEDLQDVAPLRSIMRPEDRLFGLEEGRVGLLLAGPVEKVPAVFARMLECMAKATGETAMRMGVAEFPRDGDRLDPLLERVAVALQAASPGNCALAERVFDVVPVPTADDPLAEIQEDQRHLVDPVAGVLRETDFAAALQKLVSKARRYGDSVSLLCFGIEHLQRYQEHYGDEGVDAIMGHVGRVVRTGVREIDIPGRLANDRVAVLMDADVEKSVKVARRLIEQTRNQLVQMGANSLKITLDCGVAGYPDQGDTGRQVLQRALVALDLAASSGRGACQVYDPEQDLALRRPQGDRTQEVF